MATPDTVAVLRQFLGLVNIPKPDDLVYKEEDAYSFDTPVRTAIIHLQLLFSYN